MRLRANFDGLGRFSLTLLRVRALLSLLPALERRRIAHPKAQDYADFQRALQQGFVASEMGPDVILQTAIGRAECLLGVMHVTSSVRLLLPVFTQ
jgi:hypothetical protein